MQEYRDNFIANRWTPASGDAETTLIDPSTGSHIGSVAHASAADLEAAVEAANKAFSSWSATQPAARADMLDGLLKAIERRAEEFVRGMAGEIGVPVWFGRLLQIPMPLKNGAVAVDTIRTMSWEETLGASLVRRVPAGVVAAVTPWNAPLHQIVAKVVAAMAAGCTVVLKPSEIVPSTAALFAECVKEAQIPNGVFNLVWGDAVTGSLLCRNPSVDIVSFTGSEGGGASVAEAAGRDIKPVLLELGGKSASVVLEDAPLEKAVRTVMMQCFANSGQTCVAQSRLIVPDRLADQVERICQSALADWPMGSPFDEGTRIGPLATRAQLDKVRALCSVAAAVGIRQISSRDTPRAGFYFPPTVFFDVQPDAEIARTEVFGPVLSVLRYDSIDQAIELANDTDYGLSGGVWTGDVSRGIDFAARVRTGQVSINGAPQNFLAPFGGFKRSGFGRENGRFGVEEFLSYQAIHGAA